MNSSLVTFILIFIVFIIVKKFVLNLEKDLKQKRKIERREQNSQNWKSKQKEFYRKNEEKGIDFELLAGRKFEELGYKVQYNGLEKYKLDGGIDLICTKENQKTLLVQCKNYSKANSITHEHIKVFHSNAMKYIKTNNLDEKNIELKYVVPNKEVLDISAIKVMMNDFYRCKYLIAI